jgi:hypothetical protein
MFFCTFLLAGLAAVAIAGLFSSLFYPQYDYYYYPGHHPEYVIVRVD